MVGAPKHLSDLRRIEADVRVTCRRCGFEDDWSVDDLSRHLLSIGGSTVWSQITATLRCRRDGCESGNLRLLPVPYARRTANLPRRVGKLTATILEAAVTILEQAAARSAGQAVATIEVRLALLVVHQYARDRDAIAFFWERASQAGRPVDQTMQEPMALIRRRLEDAGWIARPVMPARERVWPWNSPAPPGWRDGSE